MILQFPIGRAGLTELLTFAELCTENWALSPTSSARCQQKEISESEISKVANSSSGLSGAWIREIVQTAMIEIYAGREKVSAADLELGLKDVLSRRGLAYQSTKSIFRNQI